MAIRFMRMRRTMRMAVKVVIKFSVKRRGWSNTI